MSEIYVSAQQVQQRKLPQVSLCAVKETFHKHDNLTVPDSAKPLWKTLEI